MTRIVVLNSAAADFRELRSDFQARHAAAACEQFTADFRQLLADLKTFPDSGAPIEEARDLGLDVRQRLCHDIRVVYQHDRAHGIVYIRMFLPTRRDFLSHLTTRILRPDF
ncbi:type II toxin-antitoxin system RelE/ParE family toxin [Janthinobacterium svalbardensis]|uniref:type II toxin-antitoxin system RelE/ParE family toxin n=1 Tax=Janthinobacterium svalbardensis TaxID=368607 RepID=UPI002FCDAE85